MRLTPGLQMCLFPYSWGALCDISNELVCTCACIKSTLPMDVEPSIYVRIAEYTNWAW